MTAATPPAMLDLPVATTPVAVAAQLYVSAGFAPVPVHGVVNSRCGCSRKDCDKPGKHPVGNGWQKHASADPDATRELFDGHDGNVGIVLGGGFVVLDLDFYKDGAADALAGLGELPRTLTQRSGGGGEHRIFAYGPGQSPDEVTNRTIAPGVDVKTRYGQIVVAPSVHASGARYEWIDATPPATLPDALYERIRKQGRVLPMRPPAPVGRPSNLRKRAEAYVAKVPPAVSGSGGHNQTFAAARVLWGFVVKGLSESEAYGIFVDYNERCEPPWSERELEHKWRDAQHAEHLPALEDRPAPGSAAPPSEPPPDGELDWKLHLLFDRTKKGQKVKKHVENGVVVLRYHPAWAGKIRLDTHAQKVLVDDPPWHDSDRASSTSGAVEWADNDDVRLSAWLAREVPGLDLSKSDCKAAVEVVAEANTCHPFRDWLSSLVWDGVPRLDTWLTDFLGAPDLMYTRHVGRWWLMSAVARTFEPGCKADYVLILEGAQGLKKSTALRILCDARWFSDTPLNIGDKDAYQALQGRVVVELAELHSLKRSDVDRAKTFFSSSVDHYRPPYARRPRAVPRCCVMAGTINPDGDGTYFRDATGNRRYWPVLCALIDLAGLGAAREQLWAEATARYRAGLSCPACEAVRAHSRCAEHRWWPETPDEHRMCAKHQEPRRETDPWFEVIDEFLGDANPKIALTEVLKRACKLDVSQFTRDAEQRASRILRELGYERKQAGRAHGRAWFYERKEAP